MNREKPYEVLDKISFEAIFKTHFVNLCHFAYRYVNDRDSAQEVVQDVFITLWKKRESINAGKPVKTYLYTSVKNRCLNYLRDTKKFRSYQLDVETELEIPVEDRDMIEASEIQYRINQALDKLPPKCREVFELSRFEELKYKAISETLGISIKTVEVQMSKALKIMREELGDLIVLIILLLTIK